MQLLHHDVHPREMRCGGNVVRFNFFPFYVCGGHAQITHDVLLGGGFTCAT